MLRLWGTDGKLTTIMEGHTKWVMGALETSDGRILSWSLDETLRLWGTDGNLLAILEGHTKQVIGALELSDGRILSRDRDKNYRLWEADGTPLDTFGDFIEASLVGHEMYRADGKHVPSVTWLTNGYTFESINTVGAVICRFISDTVLGSLSVQGTLVEMNTGTVAVGDWGGKLHFLRPNRALRRLMGLEEDEAGETQ